MQRLIDANALNFEKLQDTNGKAILANEYIAFLKGAIAAEELIKNAPTIDAESVVRCKNCRFGTQSKQEPKDYFVRCIHNPFYPEHFHKNHYCGFGLKKDEEQE